MALSGTHDLREQVVYAQVANVSSTSVVYSRAPFRGTVTKVGVVLSSAASTADATCTTSLAGTNITNGVVTVTQSGSAAGSVFTSTPSAANTCNEDDNIGFTFSGSGTAGGPVTCFAVVRRA